uniref:Uncharacterized protein n=1 Tax=Alexandrium catenella TaxID=2925 RepID=A0A7S1PNI5_ALECA
MPPPPSGTSLLALDTGPLEAAPSLLALADSLPASPSRAPAPETALALMPCSAAGNAEGGLAAVQLEAVAPVRASAWSSRQLAAGLQLEDPRKWISDPEDAGDGLGAAVLAGRGSAGLAEARRPQSSRPGVPGCYARAGSAPAMASKFEDARWKIQVEEEPWHSLPRSHFGVPSSSDSRSGGTRAPSSGSSWRAATASQDSLPTWDVTRSQSMPPPEVSRQGAPGREVRPGAEPRRAEEPRAKALPSRLHEPGPGRRTNPALDLLLR